jgi:hypothetical protein
MQTMVGTILQRLWESKEEQVVKLQVYRQQTEATNANQLANPFKSQSRFPRRFDAQEKRSCLQVQPTDKLEPVSIGGSFPKELASFKGVGS